MSNILISLFPDYLLTRSGQLPCGWRVIYWGNAYCDQATGWMTEEPWFDFRQGQEISVSSERRDLLWDLPCVLFSGYRSLFPWGSSYRYLNLTTHPHLVPRLNWIEMYIYSPHMPSWRAQWQLDLYFPMNGQEISLPSKGLTCYGAYPVSHLSFPRVPSLRAQWHLYLYFPIKCWTWNCLACNYR